MTNEFMGENEPHIPRVQYIGQVQSSLIELLLSMNASKAL